MRYFKHVGCLAVFCMGIFAHALAGLAAEPAPGQPPDQPAVWQVSRWSVPQGESAQDMLTSVAALSAHYQHITIAGSGVMADSLADALQSRLGNDRISRTNEITSAETLGSFIAGTKTDLVVHITDTPPETWTANEEFVTKVQDVKDMQNTILSGLHVLRAAEGTLKDPSTIADPLAKKSVESLQTAFGDWSTPAAKQVLAQWDKDSQAADKILKGFKLLGDTNNDITKLIQGKWMLANSQLLDQGIHWLADPGAAMLLKKLKMLKATDAEALPGAVGFTELANGITQQIHDGHYSIDALDHYMDASVQASWYVVGLLLSGDNVRVAKQVGDLAVAAAKAGRSATVQPIKDAYDRYFGTQIDDAFDQWQVEQISNARRGRPLVSWEDWAKSAGFNLAIMSPEQLAAAHELYRSCQRMEEVSVAVAQRAMPIPNVDNEIEKALMAQDWAAVLKALDGKKNTDLNGVERFIKGHACLATNRNNDSILLFRDAGESGDVDLWNMWTSDFAMRNPNVAVSFYLQGDALARLAKDDKAIDAFTRGLQINPKDALILNARAICYAYLGKWDEAYVDLDDAEQLRPDLADIKANHGSLNIRRSQGAPGALEAFDAALKISPDFTLAQIGRASSLYGVGKWTEALNLVEECKKDPGSGHLAIMNAVIVRDAISNAQITMLTDPPAGTSITREQLQTAQNLRTQMASEQERGIENLRDNDRWFSPGVAGVALGDTMRDVTTGLRFAGQTLQGFRDIRSGNYMAGTNHLASSIDALNPSGIYSVEAARFQVEADTHLMNAQQLLQQQRQIFQSVKPGGIQTEDILKGIVNKGQWRLLARFALQYPEPNEAPSTQPSIGQKDKQ